MVTFVPLQEAFFVRGERRSEIRRREASGAAGLEVVTAGRRLCERRGYYCYKFHHLSRWSKMDGRILRGEAGKKRGEVRVLWSIMLV